MVQTHLGGLARLAGPAPGVTADGRDPAGVCSELVRNILPIIFISSATGTEGSLQYFKRSGSRKDVNECILVVRWSKG